MAVGLDETFDDLAFVDESGSNLEVGFASHDFDLPFLGHGVLELLLAFASHVSAEFGVRGTVVPGEGAAFAFNEGAYFEVRIEDVERI